VNKPTGTLSTHRRRERTEREVRVLIVEDAPADAELMLRTLNRSGLRTVHRVVQDEPGFRAALADFRPDVVLADNKLPRFSGRRALRIARRHDPLLPMIMVTGTLSEDRIVRLMYLGLANYVMKDRLTSLTPSVIHALDHAAEQRVAIQDREALEASERRFRAVAEASGDALLIASRDGYTVFCNAAAEGILRATSFAKFGPDKTRIGFSRYCCANCVIK
jgi:DNA-binding NtrC family response regulator